MRAALMTALLALSTMGFAAAGEDACPSLSSLFPHNDPKDYPARDTPEASVYRGSIVYEHYCTKCHGAEADGKGRNARLYDPKPANLRTTTNNRDYKRLIIQRGGAAIGRSEFMPVWGEELTTEQIEDVVNFLEAIVVSKKAANP